MIRYFCDSCGEEIKPDANYGGDSGRDVTGYVRTQRGGDKVVVSLFARLEGRKAAGGHICKYCVIDALVDTDDRPKMTVEVVS